MASNFPSSLDTFTNPSSSDAMDSVSVPHATQHSDLNDAVEALQAKVGADSSAVTTSHDYKIADHASRLTTLEALGEYTDYSGSITFIGLTLGNGTVNFAYYTRIGDLVHYVGQVTLGSTSSVTTNVSVSAPVTPNTRERAAGNAEFLDFGTAAYAGQVHALAAPDLIGFYVQEETGLFVKQNNMNPTRPFTWTTNDVFAWTVVYRAA
jgi:hypothetical protein